MLKSVMEGTQIKMAACIILAIKIISLPVFAGLVYFMINTSKLFPFQYMNRNLY